MVKSRTRVSGGFRTLAAAQIFLAIRGYISSIRRNGLRGAAELHNALLGNSWCDRSVTWTVTSDSTIVILDEPPLIVRVRGRRISRYPRLLSRSPSFLNLFQRFPLGFRHQQIKEDPGTDSDDTV